MNKLIVLKEGFIVGPSYSFNDKNLEYIEGDENINKYIASFAEKLKSDYESKIKVVSETKK